MNFDIINKAFTQYGITEVIGQEDNPEIIKYFTEIGFNSSWIKDETAWCSASMNWIAKTSGYEYTGKLNARSWLDVGVKVNNPVPGDVVVFWRGNTPHDTIGNTKLKKGHVGIYINDDTKYIYVLGGNQSNQYNIKPYLKSRLLGYRRLNKI